MALSITQTPAVVSLAQSPIVFTVVESNTALLTSASFQYVGELYYWQGALTNSGSSADYVIEKYPNTSTVGIFDINRIINSTLTDYAEANTSNVVYYAVDFYTQFYNGTQYITGSHVKSSTYKALDGYGIFQEPIGQQVYSKSPHWPLMTDGPATQSAFINNTGVAGVYVGTTGGTQPTKLVYTSNVGTADYALTSTTATTGQIQQYPIAPAESGFPIINSSLTYYTVQAYNSSTPLGTPVRYDINCIQKYPNVRIKWKNRYGQFDWMNFDLVSKQSFSTERKTYQPTIGTWEASTLTYQRYDTANQAYIVDSKQGLSVNSNWLDDAYNDILKELLVSDEIYWIYDEANDLIRPLTIVTQNIVFKTGVVDKLIQYQFEFQYGQPYKLII
jgi:hypothetical protein